MKRSIIYTILCTVLVACDLNFPPENTMVDEIVYKNEKTAEGALMGAYVRLNSFIAGAPNDQNNYANVGYSYLFGDIGTDNLMVRSDASSYMSMVNAEYSTSDHDGFIYSTWLYGYNAIDYANNVIQGVARFGEYDEQLKADHIAEAKFLRAYANFQLLCLFGDGALVGEDNGLGIIINLTPYEGYDENNIKTRSTVAESYAQIIQDLTDVINTMSDVTRTPDNRYRISKNTAKALLSRVYLYKGSYTNNKSDMDNAAKYAGEVINSGEYSFSNDYSDYRKNIFPNNVYVNSTYPNSTVHSSELIFYEPSRNSVAEYACGITQYFNKNYFYISPDLIASYAAGDYRGYVEGSDMCLINTGAETTYSSDKTTMKFDNGGGFSDVVFIRLAEIMLNRAEALTRSANAITTEAVSILNQIRRKPYMTNKPAELTASNFTSVNAFLTELLKERNRELAFEGQYRWDCIRTGRALYDKNLSNSRKMLPIPDYEVRISHGIIKQNSGFATAE